MSYINNEDEEEDYEDEDEQDANLIVHRKTHSSLKLSGPSIMGAHRVTFCKAEVRYRQEQLRCLDLLLLETTIVSRGKHIRSFMQRYNQSMTI